MNLQNSNLDHTYSRHWSEKCLFSNEKFQPSSYLLFKNSEKSEKSRNKNEEDELIDVVGVDEEKFKIESDSWFCSESRIRHQMSECGSIIEKSLEKAKLQRDPFWESKLDRKDWYLEQETLFNKTINLLHEDLLTKLATKSTSKEIISRRLSIEKSANALRWSLARCGWNMKLCQWLHMTLAENLPADLLTSYFEIIQTMRCHVPMQVDKMIQPWKMNSNTDESVASIISKRPWGPALTAVVHTQTLKIDCPAVFLFVPCLMSNQSYPSTSRRLRFWNTMISQTGNAKILNISKQFEDSDSVNYVDVGSKMKNSIPISDVAQNLLRAICWKIREVKSRFSDRKVILIGWNSTSIINCYASLLEPVDAIICCGFPISTLAGIRGSCDDDLSDVTTPTYFITGDEATCSHPSDVEDMRLTCFSEALTGSLVIHGANDHLRVSSEVCHQMNCDQFVVDRFIFEHVTKFLRSVFYEAKRLKKSLMTNKRLHQSQSLDDDASLRRDEDKISKLTFNMNTGLVSREATKRKARSSSFKSCKMSRRNEIGVTFNLEKEDEMMRKTHDETEAAVAAILGGRVEDKDKNLTPPVTKVSSASSLHQKPSNRIASIAEMTDVTASASYRASAWLRDDRETEEATAVLESLSQPPPIDSTRLSKPSSSRGLRTRGGSSRGGQRGFAAARYRNQRQTPPSRHDDSSIVRYVVSSDGLKKVSNNSVTNNQLPSSKLRGPLRLAPVQSFADTVFGPSPISSHQLNKRPYSKVCFLHFFIFI